MTLPEAEVTEYLQVYLSGVIEKINIEIFLMLFADDLALLPSAVMGLQNQLNLLRETSRNVV